eukprot:1241923-Rhodomonas_salina.4
MPNTNAAAIRIDYFRTVSCTTAFHCPHTLLVCDCTTTMRCLVLNSPAVSLRARYAVSGTDVGYAATQVVGGDEGPRRIVVEVDGEEQFVPRPPNVLRFCYGMPGPDSGMLLPD